MSVVTASEFNGTAGPNPTQQLPVELDCLSGHDLGGKCFLYNSAPARAHSPAQGWIVYKPSQSFDQRIRISYGYDEAIEAVPHDLSPTRDLGRHNRPAAGWGFKQHFGEALPVRWQDNNVSLSQ